jgi:thiamine-monophosphate kinase
MTKPSGEDDKIARIAAILGRGGARIGIGDDAAVIDPVAGPLVLTVDEQVEGTHFVRALCSLEDVGYRATMAAASDLAAMGAAPVAALSSWVLPESTLDEDVERIARGQREALGELGAFVVGGNLARGPVLSIATTWIGTCESPIARAGARAGDGVYVSGDLGLAAAGFQALSAKIETPDAAARAWRRPRARIAEGLAMAGAASAALDVSDGLARDAGHLASSSGVRVALDEDALRAHLHPATIEIARALGKDPLDLALEGGEDYALLCASRAPVEGFVRIGVIEPGEGVVLRGPRGERAVTGGFDHFE